jgi:hypothetical protein
LNIGQPEPGAAFDTLGNQQIGTTGDDTNLTEVAMIADGGETFTVAVDNLDPTGVAVGGIDWRDRGDAGTEPMTRLAEDFFKNNLGMLRVVLGELPAGTYHIISYHVDPDNSQCEEIKVLVTDADGVAMERDGLGDASYPGHPDNGNAPEVAGLTEALVMEHFNSFSVRSDGASDVIIYYDGRNAPLDDELPLNGLDILVGVDTSFRIINASIDMGTRSFSFDFNAEPGAVYAIESGADLSAFPETIDGLITADEEVERVVVPNIPSHEAIRHYRVRLETPAP